MYRHVYFGHGFIGCTCAAFLAAKTSEELEELNEAMLQIAMYDELFILGSIDISDAQPKVPSATPASQSSVEQLEDVNSCAMAEAKNQHHLNTSAVPDEVITCVNDELEFNCAAGPEVCAVPHSIESEHSRDEVSQNDVADENVTRDGAVK